MGQRRPIKPDADDRVRASKALERRLSGVTYTVIASELGYASEAGPRNAIDRMLGRIEVEGAGQLRRLEAMKLDAMQAACWEQAVSGDLDAIKTLLQVHAARVKLLGLAAPQQLVVEVPQRSTSDILEDYKDELLRSLAEDSIGHRFPIENVPESRQTVAYDRRR